MKSDDRDEFYKVLGNVLSFCYFTPNTKTRNIRPVAFLSVVPAEIEIVVFPNPSTDSFFVATAPLFS